MKRSILYLVLGLSMAHMACAGGHGEPNHHAGERPMSPPGARAERVAALAGDARSGAALFRNSCSSCHGEDGQGGGYDFSLVQSLGFHEDAELAQAMISGRLEMPAFGEVFEDQQLADLLAHIRTF